MRNFTSLKNVLLGGASVVAVGVMMVPALAQETMETVVVTGIRASLASAQSIKQNSDQVVDSITAVDIGALPDRNIAEALQRVPGVTLQRNDSPNDLVRMGSTGQSVFVRGLSWVKSLVNGRDEFTARNGRSLSFGDVSADLMQAVNIYKSSTASQIEGGVGGTVDLITRKPFDQDGMKIAVSGDYTYGDLLGAGRPSGNALFTNRWNTKLGEIGVLASVDWQDLVNRTEGINIDQYSCYNLVPYTGATGTIAAGGHQAATDGSYSQCMALPLGLNGRVMAPKGWAWRQMEFHQQRLAANFVAQWRPTDKLEFTLFAMNTYAHNQDMEHYDYNPNNGFNYTGNFVFTNMTSTLTSIDTRGGSGHNRDTDISLNVKYNPTDRLEISADAQFVESTSPYRNMTFFTGFQGTLNTGLDVTKSTPRITYSSAVDTTDPANFNWLAAMDHLENNVAHAFNARLDAKYNFEGNGVFGLIKTLELGFRTEQKVSLANSAGYNWAFLEAGWLSSSGSYVTLDGTIHCNTAPCSYISRDGTTYTSSTGGLQKAVQQAELFRYHTVLGNNVPALWVPKSSLAGMNTLASYAIMKSIEPGTGNLTGWAVGDQQWSQWIPYAAEHHCSGNDTTCAAAYDNTPGSASAGNTRSKQDEQTYAGYAQLDFAHDTFLGYDVPINGNVGLRFVRTEDQVGSGMLVMPFLSRTTCVQGTGAGESTSCADWNAALAFLGGTQYQGQTVARPKVQNGYTNWLPSFNLVAHLTDQVQARVAYYETMVRPDFSKTYSGASLGFNFYDTNSTTYGVFKSDPSGYGGNPFLKPMHATNYDASLEWYFSASNSVTLSLFHKDLSNYIFTATTTMPITGPAGQAMNFNYTTYVNGDKGKVEGFELAYTQFYDQLPGFWSGFGIQANYTKIYNSGGHNAGGDLTSAVALASAADKSLPLEGMSNDSYNLALLYNKYHIDARLAWNWRSKYLSSSSDANNKIPVWAENYGQLDASAFYDFLDHYKVGVQVTNLLRDPIYTDMGYKDFHPRTNIIQTDRKFAIVLRANW